MLKRSFYSTIHDGGTGRVVTTYSGSELSATFRLAYPRTSEDRVKVISSPNSASDRWRPKRGRRYLFHSGWLTNLHLRISWRMRIPTFFDFSTVFNSKTGVTLFSLCFSFFYLFFWEIERRSVFWVKAKFNCRDILMPFRICKLGPLQRKLTFV